MWKSRHACEHGKQHTAATNKHKDDVDLSRPNSKLACGTGTLECFNPQHASIHCSQDAAQAALLLRHLRYLGQGCREGEQACSGELWKRAEVQIQGTSPSHSQCNTGLLNLSISFPATCPATAAAHLPSSERWPHAPGPAARAPGAGRSGCPGVGSCSSTWVR